MKRASILAVLLTTAAFAGWVLPAKASDIKGSIVETRQLREGRRSPVILRLEHEGGLPIMMEELEAVGDAKLHLLVVDPALADFHHARPNPMGIQGNYIFTMTPKTDCGYDVWVDIDSVNGAREIAKAATIPGGADCGGKAVDKTPKLEFADDNYRFKIELDTGALRRGQQTVIKMTVRDKDGRYLSELQPVMGHYAQMTGFYSNDSTAMNLPVIEEKQPDFSDDLGGPVVKFAITPEKDGFIRLFTELKMNNRNIIAVFGLPVEGDMPISPAMQEAQELQEIVDPQPVETPAADTEKPVESKEKSELERILGNSLTPDQPEPEGKAPAKEEPAAESDSALEGLFQERGEGERNSDIYEDTEKKIFSKDKTVPKAEEIEAEPSQPEDPDRLGVQDDGL